MQDVKAKAGEFAKASAEASLAKDVAKKSEQKAASHIEKKSSEKKAPTPEIKPFVNPSVKKTET